VSAQNGSGTVPDANNAPASASLPQKLTLTPPKIGDGTLTTNRTSYRPGQPVALKFTIRNITKKPTHYDFSTSQQFDVTVADAQGNTVWDWAHGRVFASVITQIILKPGQEQSYRVVWDGNGPQGRPVAPGTYTLNARMTSNNRPAITGNVLVNTDTDPMNMGVPTRSPSDNGAVREIYLSPPITASTTVAIGAAASSKK
jgi:hypothetical protein